MSDRLLIASAMIETDCADSPIRNFATKEVHLRAIPDSPQVYRSWCDQLRFLSFALKEAQHNIPSKRKFVFLILPRMKSVKQLKACKNVFF